MGAEGVQGRDRTHGTRAECVRTAWQGADPQKGSRARTRPAPTPTAGVGAAVVGGGRGGRGPPGALRPAGRPILDVAEEDWAEFPQGRRRWSGGEEARNGAQVAV